MRTDRVSSQEVVLRPRITVLEAGREDDLMAVNKKAHGLCFIARSVNFPVRHEPTVIVVESGNRVIG